jgi:hypothetical protein
MKRIKNNSLLIVGILAIFSMLLCMQPSFAQSSESIAGNLLYSDNFTARKESGWFIYSDSNYTKYYEDGKYHISLFKKGLSAWEFTKRKDFRDFILEVDAAQEGGPDDNDYGVVTRYADGGNYSLILISGDGFYGYARRENSSWITPIKWIRSTAIKTGNATNALKVVSKGEALTFYVNGAKVGNFTDNKPISGKIGFWAESFLDGGAQASFDNLKVWAIKE